MNHLVHAIVLAPLLTATVAHAAPTGLEPRTPSSKSVVYRGEATIDADAAKVWHLLVDFAGYPAWNPWIVAARGPAEPGATVWVDLESDGKVTTYQHTVLVVEPEQRFCWKDAGWNSWFAYGQRCRWLSATADGKVFFRQELLIDGALAWLVDLTQGNALRAGVAAETAALKAAAER
jgi:uncharacterized protein YndB with AHSA1/START domain